MSEFNNRVALVTGASRGIGKAIALALAKAGARIAVNYRERAQEAASVVEDINRMGGRWMRFFRCRIATSRSRRRCSLPAWRSSSHTFPLRIRSEQGSLQYPRLRRVGLCSLLAGRPPERIFPVSGW